MALFKTITLTLVLQVEMKGEASEKWAIWPSSRLPTYPLCCRKKEKGSLLSSGQYGPLQDYHINPCTAGRKERRAC
jgi:hypothetical protein